MSARRKKALIVGNAPGGNYLPAVLRLAREAKLPPGAVAEVVILHDDWCAVYEGNACNCDPEVRMAWRDPS